MVGRMETKLNEEISDLEATAAPTPAEKNAVAGRDVSEAPSVDVDNALL